MDLRKVCPFVDYFTGNSVTELNFKDVAVVGSSGNLLYSKLGKRIDEHDAVIRMNLAPTGRYKDHVGSKTTIRLVAHNALKPGLFPLLKSCDYLIFWGAPQHYSKILPKVKQIRSAYPNLPIYRLTQQAMNLNDVEFEMQTGRNRLLSGAWLTTGWFSIYLAINISEKVTVCGFGCAKKSRAGIPYHYWEKFNGKEVNYIQSQEKARKGHRFITEMDVYVKWCSKYPIVFI